MERLTKLDKYGHPYTNEKINCSNLVSKDGVNYQFVEFGNGVRVYDGKPIEKLSKLEDIEEELGIPLEVLFKALKDGIYRFYEEPEDEEKHIYYLDPIICYDEDKSCWLFFDDSAYNSYYLKDYGKTWDLTKEELENNSSVTQKVYKIN